MNSKNENPAPPVPPKWKCFSFIRWRLKYDPDFSFQFVGLLLLGLAAILYAFYVLANDISLKFYTKTQAVVQRRDIKVNKHTFYSGKNKSESYSYTPILKYTYYVSGNMFTASSSVLERTGNVGKKADAEKILENYPDRKEIECYYDPDSPEKSVLNTEIPLGSFFGFLFMGAAFFVPGLIFVFVI